MNDLINTQKSAVDRDNKDRVRVLEYNDCVVSVERRIKILLKKLKIETLWDDRAFGSESD